MKEIKPLTSLRAFAAFLVFMFHYAHVYRPENLGIPFGDEWIPLMPLWRQGQVGVSIFFVLSGFLITRIYYDAIRQHQVSWRLFFVKRVARIWPLYLVFAAAQHLVPLLQGRLEASSAWLVTLTMSQGFFFDLRYEGLPTAWSLTVEESFYVLTPLVVMTLARLVPDAPTPGGPRLDGRRFLRFAVVLAGMTVVIAAVGEGLVRAVTAQGWAWHGFMGNRFHMHHATIFGRFPEFALGILAAMVHRGLDLERWLRGARATVVVLAAVAVISLSIWVKDAVSLPGEVQPTWLVLLLAYGVAAGTAVLILGLSVSGGRLHRALSHPLLVYLGRISYGFYLIQLTVLLAPAVALSHRLGGWRVPALLVMTNLICAVFYQLVEVPARRAIVRRWGGA
jgi:peptidoglycan/LPS O-acetylase OafA/YrhL